MWSNGVVHGKHADPSAPHVAVVPDARGIRIASVLLVCAAVGFVMGLVWPNEDANVELIAVSAAVAFVGALLCRPGDWWAVVPFAVVVPEVLGWSLDADVRADTALPFILLSGFVLLIICVVAAGMGALVGWLVATLRSPHHAPSAAEPGADAQRPSRSQDS
jgi:hypothetical protein